MEIFETPEDYAAEQLVNSLLEDEAEEVTSEGHNIVALRNAMREAGMQVSYARVDKKGNLKARGKVQTASDERTDTAKEALQFYSEVMGRDVGGECWPDVHSTSGVWIRIPPQDHSGEAASTASSEESPTASAAMASSVVSS